uniref:F-box domain-containing protein n=1 Tax=Panagrellus redivivus TaxID=6233 RepID=A0A7E4UTK3_PANRE
MLPDAFTTAFQYPDLIQRLYNLTPCPRQILKYDQLWPQILKSPSLTANHTPFQFCDAIHVHFNVATNLYTVCTDMTEFGFLDIVSQDILVNTLRHNVCTALLTVLDVPAGTIKNLIKTNVLSIISGKAHYIRCFLTPADVKALLKFSAGIGLELQNCHLTEPVQISELWSWIQNPTELRLSLSGIDFTPRCVNDFAINTTMKACEVFKIAYLPKTFAPRPFLTFIKKRNLHHNLGEIKFIFDKMASMKHMLKRAYKLYKLIMQIFDFPSFKIIVDSGSLCILLPTSPSYSTFNIVVDGIALLDAFNQQIHYFDAISQLLDFNPEEVIDTQKFMVYFRNDTDSHIFLEYRYQK